MFETSDLFLFATAASVLVIIPGPNSLFIIARSVEQGRAVGIVSCIGVLIGTLLHVAAAALGLSALLVSSALAFNFVKYAGAAYLIYLGLKTLLSDDRVDQKTDIVERSLRRVLFQGVIVNVLNPKSALFFVAFLPQFVDVSKGSVGVQILILGLILAGLGTLADMFYALISGSVSNLFRQNLKFLRAQRYMAGTVYVGLGLLTAFSGSKRTS